MYCSSSASNYLISIFLLLLILACTDHGPSPVKSPEQQLATFQLEEELQISLVASEPLVQDPVVIQFDPQGRLWVIEMRGFMPNIDGEGEEEPNGRISVLIDSNSDGEMDEQVIFLDSLVLPRALAFVPGGVVVAENKPLWFVQDTDGDLIADRKVLLDSLYGGRGLPEHSPNGLWRNLDNWHYNAKSKLRYQFGQNGTMTVDSTEFRGQWGICHDDEGRLFYNYNWSPLHADLVPPNSLSRNANHEPTTGIDHGLTIERGIFPIRPNPAINRGYIPGTLNENGRLIEFTSACAPLIYRGDLLPDPFKGNAFICEPAGNLIKRHLVEADGPLLSSSDPHPGTEFLASTDERFRPVYLTNGPDGALYIADMYRGINQHGLYMTPYLKEQTLARKLDQPIHKGRIWRISPKNSTYQAGPKLSKDKLQPLLQAISADNGWLRDVAQRLLMEANLTESIIHLEEILFKGPSSLGRLHALWTLEGMDQLKPEMLLLLLEDREEILQINALKIMETLSNPNPSFLRSLSLKLLELQQNASPKLALQIVLTANTLEPTSKLELLQKMALKHTVSPLMRDAFLSSLEGAEFSLLQLLYKDPDWKEAPLHHEIFIEMLAHASAINGNSEELVSLLNILDRPESSYSYFERALLKGLAQPGRVLGNHQKIALAEKPKVFAALEQHSASMREDLQFLQAYFGWPGKPQTLDQSSKQNLKAEERLAISRGRTLYLSLCAGCHGSQGEGLKRFAPPLANSEWVTGDAKRLVLILLHGLEGPLSVGGIHYDAPEILPVMPAHSTLDDQNIADISTYIRNEWGHQASSIERSFVGKTRVTSQGRVFPWTEQELLDLPIE